MPTWSRTILSARTCNLPPGTRAATTHEANGRGTPRGRFRCAEKFRLFVGTFRARPLRHGILLKFVYMRGASHD